MTRALSPLERRAASAMPITGWPSERQLMDACLEWAQWCGWKVEHAWTSIHSAAGYPDATLIRGDRCVVVEFKSATGRVSTDQADWMDAFAGAGVETYLVYPWDQDWFMNEVLAA